MADPRQLETTLRALAASTPSVAQRDHGAHLPPQSDAESTRLARTLATLQVRIELADAPGYPRGLLDLSDPPRALFIRGRLPDLDAAVAIIGSRAATPYGRAQARRLAADLVGLGFTIVSGLARGIDGAAHEGALEAGGATAAVIPGGLDAVTPRHHRALAERIVERGGLASEFATGLPKHRGIFVRRNRLIAALAAATIVVEAAERSGSLSTAAAARRLKRPVLAVPGDVERVTSRGCHALLRGGARVCEGIDDVLNALKGHPVTGTPEARILAALEPRPSTIEAIARSSGLSTRETLAGLLKLEWSGAARAQPGQRWMRRGGAGP